MGNVGSAVPESFHPPGPDTLEGYYRSIEDLFEQTRKLRELEGKGGTFDAITIILFVFCLLPAVPYVVSKLMRHFTGARSIHVLHVSVSSDSFWFWWIVLFVLSLMLLILRFALKGPSDEERQRALSPSQLRFAYCYGAVNEIVRYQTNRMPQHLETGRVYIDALSGVLKPVVVSDEGFTSSGPDILLGGQEFYYVARSRSSSPKMVQAGCFHRAHPRCNFVFVLEAPR